MLLCHKAHNTSGPVRAAAISGLCVNSSVSRGSDAHALSFLCHCHFCRVTRWSLSFAHTAANTACTGQAGQTLDAFLLWTSFQKIVLTAPVVTSSWLFQHLCAPGTEMYRSCFRLVHGSGAQIVLLLRGASGVHPGSCDSTPVASCCLRGDPSPGFSHFSSREPWFP